MSHHDVVVIGGGLGGVCIAAHQLTRGRSVAIIEPSALASSFTGGLKYTRDSVGFRRLLDDVGMDYMVRAVEGGILMPNLSIVPFPGSATAEQLDSVQRLHYRKTRGTDVGFTPGAMNFGGGGSELVFDVEELVSYVEERAKVIDSPAHRVSGTIVGCRGAGWVEGKSLISTIPLPLLCRLLALEGSELPTCEHEMLATAFIAPSEEGTIATLPSAYVYTPWLKVVHRLSANGDQVEAEWNARLGSPKEDLKLLGMELDSKVSRMPGHLHPVVWGSVKPVANTFCGISLAGRFAEWCPRRTVDQTVDRLYEEPGTES